MLVVSRDVVPAQVLVQRGGDREAVVGGRHGRLSVRSKWRNRCRCKLGPSKRVPRVCIARRRPYTTPTASPCSRDVVGLRPDGSTVLAVIAAAQCLCPRGSSQPPPRAVVKVLVQSLRRTGPISAPQQRHRRLLTDIGATRDARRDERSTAVCSGSGPHHRHLKWDDLARRDGRNVDGRTTTRSEGRTTTRRRRPAPPVTAGGVATMLVTKLRGVLGPAPAFGSVPVACPEVKEGGAEPVFWPARTADSSSPGAASRWRHLPIPVLQAELPAAVSRRQLGLSQWTASSAARPASSSERSPPTTTVRSRRSSATRPSPSAEWTGPSTRACRSVARLQTARWAWERRPRVGLAAKVRGATRTREHRELPMSTISCDRRRSICTGALVHAGPR